VSKLFSMGRHRPLETQHSRAKCCPNSKCNADFAFTNNELQTREVTNELGLRGHFFDSEIR
jgi:hypothetical protein